MVEEEDCRQRLRRLELRQDKKKREEGRNNVVIRGLEIERKVVREKVRKLCERMDLEEGGIKEVVRIGDKGKVGNGMVLVKLAGRGEKLKVMEAKKTLKGMKERIEDDLTVEEGRVRWRIEMEAEEERDKGRKV